uniref:Uncharacterized protein n=1 Tax=Dunaliella tertiolecta TaxID=3047 RepID=A0A7S3R445_DUNTE
MSTHIHTRARAPACACLHLQGHSCSVTSALWEEVRVFVINFIRITAPRVVSMQQQQQQQEAVKQEQKLQQEQEQQQQQDAPGTTAQQPESTSASPAAAAASPKILKKLRKAEAAAAAAAAWGKGGIGSRSTEASPMSIPDTSAPASAKKQGKKARADQAHPHAAPVSVPAAAAAATAGGDFAFSAAGISGQGVAGGSSPSTPTLGKSAVKKDKKRKAERAGDDGMDPWEGMDGQDGFVELASVGKSGLKSSGAKGRASIPTGVDDGDGSQQQQQQSVLRSSGKKHKNQLQKGGGELEALKSPQEVLLQPLAPKSALKSALKQQSTPALRSALKHTGAMESVADGVDLAAAGREALRTAMRHRSFAADDVEMKSGNRSALKAHRPAPHTSGAPEAAAPSFTNALQVRLAQEADATTTPMPSPGVGKRTRMEQQQQSQGARSTPQGNGAAAAEPKGPEKSSSGKKRRAAAAAGGPATSARKAVRINLRNNLYFEHGGPIPDPMIRTPPTARSKGSILKRAQESLAAMGIPSTPKSAPAKLQKQQQLQAARQQQQPGSGGKHKQPKSAHVTPIKSPRAKAELFF